MGRDSLYGPRFDVPLIAFALSVSVVFLDMLNAHRESSWTTMTPELWVGTGIAVAFYVAILIILLFAIRFVAARVLPTRWFAGKPMLVEPVVIAAGIFTLVVWLGGGVRITGIIVALAFAIVIATARIWRWTRGGGGLRRFSIGWIAVMAGAMAGLVIGNEWLYNTDNRALWSTVTAFIAMALVIEIWGFLVGSAHAVRNREGGWAVVAGLGAIGLTAAVLAGILGLYLHPSDTNPDDPNLLLITSDALRADVLGLYDGDVPTPKLIALGENSVVFDRAYAVGPWTLPSMFGLFSSQYPHGLNPIGDRDTWSQEITLYRMEKDTETLAERLRDKGYNTAAFVGNYLLRDQEGILRGFETTTVTGHRTHTFHSVFSAQAWLETALFKLGLPWIHERPIDTTDILTKHAETFLADERNQPYFLWVHFMDPHTPYAPPHRYAPENGPWPVYCNADPHWGTPLTDEEGRVDLSSEEKEHVRTLYEGEVRYVDAAVGRLIASAQNHPSETYIAFTADHGEEFWDHGEYGHGQSLFEEQVRVPLIIAGPDLPAQRIAQPVSLIDLMPTLAALTAAESDPAWHGTSFALALHKGEEPENPSPVFAQGTNLYSRPEPTQMLVQGNWKAVRGVRSGDMRYYNLAADPDENHPVSPTEAPVPTDMADRLRDLGRRMEEPVGQIYERKFSEDDPAALREELRGLGYIH